MEFSAIMLVMLLVGGGDNTGDLLDYTPTEMYWEMRDERIIDLDTMAAVLANDDATPTDTLMAIRAIGEWVLIQEADPDIAADPADKAKAIKILTPYVGSKKPFVDSYAKRSIAWLKGVEPDARKALPAEVYDLDLALLPSDSTLVGQMKITNGVGPMNLAELIPDIKIEGQSMREQMMAQVLPGLMQSVQAVGNVRADVVTMGMVLNNEEDISFMVVARGQYDRVAIQMLMEEELGDDDDASFYSVGDTEIVTVDNHDPFAMLMPSDELFIVLFSEQRGTKLPIGEVAKKLSQADRKPSFDAVLANQIDAIDREKADVWAAMKVTQMMKNEREVAEVFGAFDAARASAVRDAKGMLDIQWAAKGSNEAAVGETTQFFTDSIQEGITEINEQKHQMPAEMQAMMDPVLAMMKSMNFKHDGKTMTGGMKVDPSVGTIMPMMMFGMSVDHRHHAAEVQFAEEAAIEAAVDAVEEAVAE